MENNSAEILRGIEAELASLKEKVRDLEERLDEYRKTLVEEAPVVDAVPEEADFSDMEIGITDLPETAAEPAPAAEDLPETAGDDLPEPVDIELPEPMVVETIPEPVPEPVAEPEPAPAPAPKPAAPRPETERMAWRIDKPGVPVKNIRSGISLYDRALFIGTLFKEDYALYDRTISELNGLPGLEEAVDYLLERFPDWNFKSDIVYNFMMAIRKKLG